MQVLLILVALLALAAWSYACYRLGKWSGRRQVITSMTENRPTDKQLAYLDSLATELGVEHPTVSTAAEAARKISGLESYRLAREYIVTSMDDHSEISFDDKHQPRRQ